MSRRVVSSELQAAATGSAGVDTYFDRLLKYIPADVVAAWLFVTAAIDSASDVPATTLQWIAFVFLLAFTPLWTLRQTRVTGRPPAVVQSLIALGSFAVWVFALGGPFTGFDWYRALYGSLLLVAFTLVIALVSKPEGAA